MSYPIFIETSSITANSISGVGNTLLAILRNWNVNSPELIPILLVPYDKKKKVESYNLNLEIKTIPLPEKVVRGLRRYNLLPSLDIFYGKGVYLFPNYWNWPLKNSRSLTYVYDVSFLVDENFTDSKNRKFLTKYLPVWLQRTDRVVTISQHAKSEIMKYYSVDENKINVVYNGVDTKLFEVASTQEIEKAKQTYGIEGEYLLFVGNIEPRKNISRLIEAYKQLPGATSGDYSLIIIGGYGWNNEAIKMDIENAVKDGYKVLKVQKYVADEDLPALYSGATALVHPALYEGFGMTPLEAMSVGTPVVVAQNSSLPEVVGGAGLYVDAMNVDDISAKIKIILEDPGLRGRLSRAGKERAQKFTWGKTVEGVTHSIEGLEDE